VKIRVRWNAEYALWGMVEWKKSVVRNRVQTSTDRRCVAVVGEKRKGSGRVGRGGGEVAGGGR
jgi:hypothetical protein